MKSPFPGMDPYIESCGLWEEFHDHLIEKLYEIISDAVPERYVVRTRRRFYWDHADDIREKFLEVYETSEKELNLVTCIEALSPANKRKDSEGWRQYLRKRQTLLLGQVNLVELDLLRGGQKMPMLDPWPDCPYTLLVYRRERAHKCAVHPASSLQPLPQLSIPLRSPDPEISVSLQPLVDAIYRRGRFHRFIDYNKPCNPSLPPQEIDWLHQQLKAHTATDQ